MAKVIGRRPDETSDEQAQQFGPEKWAVAAFAILLVLVIIGLLVLAA